LEDTQVHAVIFLLSVGAITKPDPSRGSGKLALSKINETVAVAT
jgi:hypothetical protein